MALADVPVRPAAACWSVSDARSLLRSKVPQHRETDLSFGSESTMTLIDAEFSVCLCVARANGFTPMKWLKFKPTYHIPQHLNQELRLSGL